MDPNDIEIKGLENLTYQKIASEIDSCDDRDMLKNIAKSLQNYIINSKKQRNHRITRWHLVQLLSIQILV